ncbi:MAG: protein kinase [Verrucomicrobiota bacterium]|nr:protein kinase [Verrucomicrobiota bacterium]
MQITGFEMLEKLGEGGMATVWKARQVSLDRIVAIKILSSRLAPAAKDIEMFRREAQAAAKLKHPGIVQVYDASMEKGRYYFVMEFVAGYTVGDWMRRAGVLPEKDALLVAECVADAMEYAWERERIIHCDIKPDNVMVDSDGAVKVADLGLARTLNAMSISSRPAHRDVMGTPAYMSPEQARGSSNLDSRTDIYSLGAMLYQLVTGKMLFEGSSDTDTIQLQIAKSVNDPLEMNPKLSKPVCYLIEKMLAKDAGHRQKDWSAARADIVRVKRKQMPADILPEDGLSTARRSQRRASVKMEPWRPAAPDEKSRAGPWARIGIVAGAAAVVVLVSWLATRRLPSNRVAAPALLLPALVPRPAAVPAPVAAEESAEDQRAKVMFELARQWALDNPEKLDEAIEQFNRVIAQIRNTPYAAQAEAEMRRLSDLWDGKTREVIEKLKSETEELRRARDYAKAAEVFENYQGPYASLTASKRASIAGQLRNDRTKVEEVREKEKQTAEQKLAKTLDEAVAQLVKAGIPAAMSAIAKAMSDEELAEKRAKLRIVERVLKEADSAAKRIPESFNAQKGRETTVELKTRKVTLVVTGVSEGKVSGQQTMLSAKVPTTFDLAELSPREKLVRLGSEDAPGVPLVKGLIALEFKAYPQARKCFGKVAPILSARLTACVGKEESDLSAGEAEAALSRLMQSFGLPGGKFDAGIWLEAIRAKTITPEESRRLADAVLKYRATRGECEFANAADDILVALEKLAESAGKPGANRPADSFQPLLDSAPLRMLKPEEVEGKNAAVIRKFMSRNLRMAKTDIQLFADDEGVVRRVQIASPGLEDVTPAAEWKELRELYAGALPFHNRFHGEPIAELSGVAGLRGARIEALSLCQTSVKDLASLKGLPLKELYLRNTPVADVAPLKGMSSLQILDLHSTKVKDLSPLRGMRFHELNLSACKIFDYSSLKGMAIRNLNLSRTQFKDDSIFTKTMPVKILNIAETKVRDFNFLADLPLENLDVSQTQIKDISMLAGKDMNWLNLNHTAVTDIGVLKEMMTLRGLLLEKTLVKDFSPLEGLELHHLNVADTRIQDLSALEGMPLRRLDMSRTSVGDLMPLRGMELRWLNIGQTDARDLAALRGMPLHYLNCRQIKTRDLSPLIGMNLRNIELDNPEAAQNVLRTMPQLEWVNGRNIRE